MIKKLLLITSMSAIILMSSLCEAKNTKIDCQSIGKTGELVMYFRQHGVSMYELYDMNLTGGSDDRIRRHIIFKSFTVPQFSSSKNKKEAISDFKDVALRICDKEKQRKITDKRLKLKKK